MAVIVTVGIGVSVGGIATKGPPAPRGVVWSRMMNPPVISMMTKRMIGNVLFFAGGACLRFDRKSCMAGPLGELDSGIGLVGGVTYGGGV